MPRYLLAFLLTITSWLTAGSLEDQIQKELELLNLPAPSWRQLDDSTLDVAIVGAGQAGIALAHALELEGIYNVRVYDAAPDGKEGPWLTTARMLTLRSGKKLRGPALLPSLTFQAWCEAKYGKEAFEDIGKIPTKAWGKYLKWLKKVSSVTVFNDWLLERIEPNSDYTLTLHFEGSRVVRARKVVLATGRCGFGGAEIPEFVQSLPKKLWAHTSERIDPRTFKNKRVAVVGVGASGFDAAAAALENGANKVEIIMRRKELPQVNYASLFAYPGFLKGFYFLTDNERCDFFSKVIELGIPPPQESIDRLKPFSNFTLVDSAAIDRVEPHQQAVRISTSKAEHIVDLIVLATGYKVDGSKQAELRDIIDQALLWKDVHPNVPNKLGSFPYLGLHFEFLEKEKGTAPWLANIHCFNYGAFLSHGRIAGDIDALPVGITRLVEGLAVGLFLQDTCRNGEPTPHECPGTCQSGICSPFHLSSEE